MNPPNFHQLAKLLAAVPSVCLTSFLLSWVVAEPVAAEAIFVSHAGKVNPQGMTSQDRVELTVRVGCDNGTAGVQGNDYITDMQIYYTTNGTNSDGFGGQPKAGSQALALKWDSNVPDSGCPTGFAAVWKGKLPPQPLSVLMTLMR